VGDRATFEVAGAKDYAGTYDLICFFDCLHDMGDPVGTAAHAREHLEIRRALNLILREAGYEVLVASSAAEALDRAALDAPHLAIVDLVLPDTHGIELCGRLREWSEMPILV